MASSSAAYATGADLVKFHDARRIGDLVSDSDTRVSAAQVPNNAVVVLMLGRASGEVEMAAQVGGRYTPDDLNSLDGVAQDALKGLVCDLAMWHIERRHARGISQDDVPGTKEAYQVLEALKDGELIFPTDAALSAVAVETVEDTAGAAVDVSDPNSGRYGRTVNAFRGFFGRRGGDCR